MPAASLSAATAGDLDRSRRQREVRRPNGFGDELRVVLAGPTGSWGSLTLLRESGRPDFTAADVRFVASLTATLADGVRRAMLVGRRPARRPGAGDRVPRRRRRRLRRDGQRAGERWLDELSSPPRLRRAPVAVRSVVTRTRRVAAGERDVVASARVCTRRWPLGDRAWPLVGADRVAVLIEPPRPAELASAIADAYGLTERERTVTELWRGASTKEIADHLHLSAYTVQDHLKAIFEQTGTSSRGELVARLFLDHHAPRFTSSPTATRSDPVHDRLQ